MFLLCVNGCTGKIRKSYQRYTSVWFDGENFALQSLDIIEYTFQHYFYINERVKMGRNIF